MELQFKELKQVEPLFGHNDELQWLVTYIVRSDLGEMPFSMRVPATASFDEAAGAARAELHRFAQELAKVTER